MNWREREQSRFECGLYKRPHFIADGLLEEITDHYLHISNENSELVAFTENPEKGERDIQTRLKPGKYLRKYYPALTLSMIRDIVTGGENSKELLFASTPEDIEMVYYNGPSSCMSKVGYYSSIHPVRVYGNSDLQVAYLKDSDGRITARAIVWPEKKRYGRIYGDIIRLETKLKKVGYNRGTMIGAKLPLIKEIHNKYERIVCPYIDDTKSVVLKGDNLYVSSFNAKNKLNASNADGFASGRHCESCGVFANTYNVYGNPTVKHFCKKCCKLFTTECEMTGRRIENGKGVFIQVHTSKNTRVSCYERFINDYAVKITLGPDIWVSYNQYIHVNTKEGMKAAPRWERTKYFQDKYGDYFDSIELMYNEKPKKQVKKRVVSGIRLGRNDDILAYYAPYIPIQEGIVNNPAPEPVVEPAPVPNNPITGHLNVNYNLYEGPWIIHDPRPRPRDEE